MNVEVLTGDESSPARFDHPDSGRNHSHDHSADDDQHHGHAHAHEGEPRPVIFESDDHRAELEALRVLAEGLRDADLAAPPVVLPDFYHKHNLEMPSSIAVATRETIRPTLTSSSVNCGMALIALDGELPDRAAVDAFYDDVKRRYPTPPTRRLELTHAEVLEAAVRGAGFAIDRWGIEAAEIDRVELGGAIDLEPYGGAAEARADLPWMLTQLSRMRFGTIGPSNHFLELQRVEEVLQADVAARLGIAEGQLTIQYHNGGGPLAGAMGALFGKRIKVNRAVRAIMRVQRPAYHLASARSIDELKLRMKLYFSGGCPPVPLDSDEGRRLMLANAVAMNYGFAFRQATYAHIRSAARRHLASGSRLIVDSPHNSIYEEEVGGSRAVVHRHNTSRAYGPSRMAGHELFAVTGQPVLVPGTNRTSSYLCVAADGSERSLRSSCHGTGNIVKEFAGRGLSVADPEGRVTLRYGYDRAEPAVVEHLDDRGVDEGVRIMVANGLVKPVARMRPIAVLN